MSLTFPAKARLKTRAEFEEVKNRGVRLVGRHLILNVWHHDSLSGPRLGVITTRRTGPACDRSRARRLIRESFRLNRPQMTRNCHMVVVAKSSITRLNLAPVMEEFLKLCRKSGVINESEKQP